METPRTYHCALITGASSGLGEEYARQLAPACDAIVLVARRGQLLEDLSNQLTTESPGTEVFCVSSDLTNANDRAELIKTLQSLGMVPDLLVNNAGMGDYGSFSSADWPKLDAMLQLNITALTHLCHALLPAMITRGKGAVINVSSLASALPMPDFAVYAASKAYVTSFSDALRSELAAFNIPVLAVCPGPVHTHFGEVAMRGNQLSSLPSREGFYTSREKVVSQSIDALLANKARVYPSWKITLLAAGISILPMAVIRTLLANRRADA
ncbi:MAG: SDR family NAD(P)-dependent oxidoreductase [Verrucomicrobiae bacterium]|nr:SDR family NAD(P)-dependent oxidoreductase [Verrucomicrobiae bacterium]NNJ43008.1 SDR family NAD(P)-dependent oxidoreductase [Akkermansiaceae bacterium]